MQPITSRTTNPASRHASVRIRNHTSSPGLTRVSTSASPIAERTWLTMPSRRPSPGSAGGSHVVSLNRTTAGHDRFAGHRLGALAAPARAHVLVLDPLLEQDDALEQGFGTGRAARHVDVDR